MANWSDYYLFGADYQTDDTWVKAMLNITDTTNKNLLFNPSSYFYVPQGTTCPNYILYNINYEVYGWGFPSTYSHIKINSNPYNILNKNTDTLCFPYDSNGNLCRIDPNKLIVFKDKNYTELTDYMTSCHQTKILIIPLDLNDNEVITIDGTTIIFPDNTQYKIPTYNFVFDICAAGGDGGLGDRWTATLYKNRGTTGGGGGGSGAYMRAFNRDWYSKIKIGRNFTINNTLYSGIWVRTAQDLYEDETNTSFAQNGIYLSDGLDGGHGNISDKPNDSYTNVTAGSGGAGGGIYYITYKFEYDYSQYKYIGKYAIDDRDNLDIEKIKALRILSGIQGSSGGKNVGNLDRINPMANQTTSDMFIPCLAYEDDNNNMYAISSIQGILSSADITDESYEGMVSRGGPGGCSHVGGTAQGQFGVGGQGETISYTERSQPRLGAPGVLIIYFRDPT